MAAPFQPPTPDDIEKAAAAARDWVGIIVSAVVGFLTAMGFVWRWAHSWLTANEARIVALEHGYESLRLGQAETKTQIARLPTREEITDQFNRVNLRLDRLHDAKSGAD